MMNKHALLLIIIPLLLLIASPFTIAPGLGDEPAPWVQTNGPVGGIISTIEIDLSNPDILYAGGMGGGVFKTTDSGATWTMLEKLGPFADDISNILISPADTGTVYAVIIGNLFKSTDGGESWREITNEHRFKCVKMDPTNPSVLIAGTDDGKVYRSTDSGESWMDITGDGLPGDRISDIGIGASNELWVGTANGIDGRLYHTTNGGTSWDEVGFGKPEDTDIRSIYIDSEDTDIVYVGLTNVYNEGPGPNEHYLHKTEDGGETWTPIPPTDPRGGMIAIMCKDPTNDMLYISIGGAIFKTNDDGQNWINIELLGGSGDMYDIAIDPRDSNVLYLPRRSHGIVKSTDGGETWTPINQGIYNIGVSLLAVPNVPRSSTVYATSSGGEGTFKTTNWGNSWTYLNGGGITHPWADELVVSPHDPETVWQVGDVAKVFVTTDGGTTWDTTINPYSDGFRFGSVYAVAPAPSNPDTIYVLKNGFGIFKSTDGGGSWRFLHQSEVDYTYSIAVHPTNPDIVYSGYSPKPFQDGAMVRQTTDGGNSWRTALMVPHASGITSVAIDPNDPDTVYAGSTGEGGIVWVSRDAGESWASVNESFNFTNIHVMTADPVDPDVAYAGVWGGGTFKTTDGGQSWNRLPNDPTISASAILVDPTNPDVIYLADRTSPRIYHTTNGGASWDIFFDAGKGYYRVLSATLAPSNPDILYVSIFRFGEPFVGDLFRIENGRVSITTGTLPRLPLVLAVDPTDADTVYAVLHADGVYKSTNGGQSWSHISGPGSGLPQSPAIGFNSLVIDPNEPSTMYLLGGGDVVGIDLTHTGADPAVMHTVYKSTDGGTTWINLNDGNLGTSSDTIKGLAISPAYPDVLYIGALKGVFQSIDGGSSWTNISAGLGYTYTAGVALSSDGARLYAPTLGGGVYAGTVNMGTHDVTWDVTSHLAATIYHVQVAVDPTDSQKLYTSAYPGGTFKSVDGGLTWTESNFGMASFKIDDPNRQGYYAFAIAPSDPDVLYLGLYGVGMYKSTDGAGTWLRMNGSAQTMHGKFINSLVIDLNNADIVYVATEDGVYRTNDGGVDWADFSTGLDCTDVRVLAMGDNGMLYAGTRGYELYYYDQGDATWRQMNAFGNFGIFWPIWNDRPLYQYTSLLFHPTDPNVIYFGTFPAGIYKSDDGGQSWRESNVGWTNDGVFSLVFHPDNSDIIYAGTYNGVNRSTDGGAHWEMWDNGWPDEQWVFSIAFDPRDPNVMYASSKNGENEGNGREEFHGTVMKSLNGGASWFAITTGLNVNQEFYKIIVDKFDPDTLYLATQGEGVFISRDGGALWSPFNEGLTNLIAGTNGNNVTNTMVLSADGAYLYFGSAGSGVFRRQVATPAPGIAWWQWLIVGLIVVGGAVTIVWRLRRLHSTRATT